MLDACGDFVLGQVNPCKYGIGNIIIFSPILIVKYILLQVDILKSLIRSERLVSMIGRALPTKHTLYVLQDVDCF